MICDGDERLFASSDIEGHIRNWAADEQGDRER